MLASKCELLPCGVGSSFRRSDDGFRVLADTGRGGRVFNHHLCVSSNDHEQIVKVVCNPTRQASDSFHFLSLTNLFFERPAGTYLAGDHHDSADRRIVLQIVSEGFEPHPRAIFMTKTKIGRDCGSSIQNQALQYGSNRRKIFGMDKVEKTLAQQLRGAIAPIRSTDGRW